MLYNKAKSNVRVLNKVTGQEMIIKVGETEDLKIAIAYPVDENGEIAEGDKVTITEQNAICFRLIDDPNPMPTPEGYTVVNGVLTDKNGNQVEQGEIVVEKILAVQPGILVLAVKPREGDGFDLFTYMPEKDSFRKILRSTIAGETYTEVEPETGNVLIVYKDVKDAEEKDEDGKVVNSYQYLEAAGILYIKDSGKVVGARLDGSEPSLDPAAYVPVVGGDDEILIPEERASEFNEYDEASLEKCPEQRYILFSKESGYARVIDTYGKVVSASVNRFGGTFLRGEGQALVNDYLIKTPKIDEISGKYVVDVTADRDEIRYTFADDQYNTQTLIRRETRDRGMVYSIA